MTRIQIPPSEHAAQLARRPLKVESHGVVPFLLGGGPVTTWMGGSCVACELVLLRKLVRPDKEEVAAVLQNLLKPKVKKPLPVRQGMRREDHGRYLAAGVCIAIILLSASGHASAIRAFGEVEPGGGKILDLKNFVSRMVIVPTCRSTSARVRRLSSPNRNPAQ
jgi:hypothetical protein